LWSTDVALNEDSIRSGGKNAPGADYLRWFDIGVDTQEGRIEEQDLDSFTVKPGQGLSMFIKKMFPKSFVWIGPGPMTGSAKKAYKNTYSNVRNNFGGK